MDSHEEHDHKHEEKIKSREELIAKNIKDSFDVDRENLSEKEILVEVIYNCFMNSLNSQGHVEMKDMANLTVETLEQLGHDTPISHDYIKSLFNFNSIYRPLYDLLDLAIDYSINGKKMSEDYRNGVIDSIITLRRFQRFNGFGDHEWLKDFNYAVDKPKD